MTRVRGPASAMISWSLPTCVKRPSEIATAVAVGWARFSVVNRPWCRIMSAMGVSAMVAVLRDRGGIGWTGGLCQRGFSCATRQFAEHVGPDLVL